MTGRNYATGKSGRRETNRKLCSWRSALLFTQVATVCAQTDALVARGLMTWGYSIDFQKRAVCLSPTHRHAMLCPSYGLPGEWLRRPLHYRDTRSPMEFEPEERSPLLGVILVAILAAFVRIVELHPSIAHQDRAPFLESIIEGSRQVPWSYP